MRLVPSEEQIISKYHSRVGSKGGMVERAKQEVALLSPMQEAAALDQWSCYFMGVKQALAEPFKEELLS